MALKSHKLGAASLCGSPSLPKPNPHTELRIEDVFDTVWRVIGGRSAFFYREEAQYGSPSLGGRGTYFCPTCQLVPAV